MHESRLKIESIDERRFWGAKFGGDHLELTFLGVPRRMVWD